MRRAAFILFIATCPLFLEAQDPEGNYNPYVNSGTISPAPLYPLEVGGTGVISLNIGNTGSDPLVLDGAEGIILKITLSNGEPDNIDPEVAIGGTSSGLFSWAYDAGIHTYTGTQIATIPATSSGTITIDFKVSQNSNAPGTNGFNVNIAPAPYQNDSNSENDDAVSSYTYTEIRDYGDAPTSYGTADHILDFTNYLGTEWDGELAYLASADASGDDVDGIDDEDGVLIPSTIYRGDIVNIPVTVTGGGLLSVWIDWTGDGDFDDIDEDVASNVSRSSGTVDLLVTVPADATISAPTFARFRLSQTFNAPSSGSAGLGEVEDYQLSIQCDPPIPTLTITETAFCAGTEVVFTAGGGVNYEFRVDGSPVQTGVSTTYTSDALTDGQVVDVIVTDEYTCSATSSEIAITVYPLPLSTLISSADGNESCDGSNVTFLASGGSDYDFLLDDISVQSGALNSYVTSSLINGQVMEVVVTDDNNCVDTSTAIINSILPLPEPTLLSSEGFDPFCIGTTVEFTASGGQDYVFRVDNVEAQSGTSATYISDSLVNGQIVDVVVTDANGCVGTSSEISNVLLALPLPTLSSTDNTFCDGTEIVFTAGGGDSYEFRVDGIPQQSGTSNTYSISTLEDGQTVDVIVTDVNVCFATSSGIMNTVYPLPDPTLASDDPDALVCAGTIVEFSAGGGATYNFRVDGFSAQSGALDTYSTDSLANNQTVDVIVTSTEGCMATSDGIQFSVEPNPTAEAGVSPGDICQGGTTIELDGSVGGSAAGGIWSTAAGGVFLPSATSLNATWTPPSDFDGSATLVLTTDGGNCGIATSSLTQVVHSPPTPPEVSDATPFNVCPSETIDLTALVTTPTPVGGLILFRTVNDPEGSDVAVPAAVGAGIYYIFYQSLEGCYSTGTEVTVTINNCPPDVTPTLTVSPNIMRGVTTFDLIVRVTELNGVNTSGIITVNMPIDTRWDLTEGFSTILTNLGGTDLNNSDWTYSSDEINRIFTTSTPIPAGGSSTFGFRVTFDPLNSRGTYNITTQIVSGGGGELRVSNNADSDSIDYFQE